MDEETTLMTETPAEQPAESNNEQPVETPTEPQTGDAQQEPETQAEGQPPAETEAESEKEEALKPQAPEQYEFEVADGAVGEKVMETYQQVAKELDLPNDKAQMVLDKMLPVMQAHQMEQAEGFYQDIGGMPDTWEGAAMKDSEFGGDKIQENLATAKKAMDAFASPELKTLLNKTKLGNHPEMIRMFYRAGQSISEDRFVSGNRNPNNQGDARRLYAASNMNP